MYHVPQMYPNQLPHYAGVPFYNYVGMPGYSPVHNEVDYADNGDRRIKLRDYGSNPFVININQVTKRNNTFRTALWSGSHLQLTLMSLKPGEDIGLELHPNVDQFLRIEQGQGFVQMGNSKDNLTFTRKVYDDSAIFIPAGTWHNLTNTGKTPLKLYSIYAPPNHPFGTVHGTKAEAIASERYVYGYINPGFY